MDEKLGKYTFMGYWKLLNKEKPMNAQRVLVTNGDSIIIGSVYLQDTKMYWTYDRGTMEGYEPIAWMELPSVVMFRKYEL